MSLRTKYAVLKATTIALGALSIPWSTYIGFCFGEGRYSTGLVALCVQTVVSLIDGYIWFWVLENMKRRLEVESGELENASKIVLGKGQALNCAVCGQILSPARAVFRCQCGHVSHAECWEKHIVTSHCPSFKLGYVTADNRLELKQVVGSLAHGGAAEGVVAARMT